MLGRDATLAAGVLSLLLLFPLDSAPAAIQHRSRSERLEFTRLHPCPVARSPHSLCPGYQVDHVIPLCRGGADRVWNMQWLTVAEHLRKTRVDVAACARVRAHP